MKKYDLLLTNSIPVTEGSIAYNLIKVDRITKDGDLTEDEIYKILRNSVSKQIPELDSVQTTIAEDLPGVDYSKESEFKLGKILSALSAVGVTFSLLEIPETEPEDSPTSYFTYFIQLKDSFSTLPNCYKAMIREFDGESLDVSIGEILLSPVDNFVVGSNVVREVLGIEKMKDELDKAKSAKLNYFNPEILKIYESFNIKPMLVI